MRLLQISIPSELHFERVARESAAIVARYLGFPEERGADLQLAVSEAVTNAIEHGNCCRPEEDVAVRFVLSGERVDISVVDGGGDMPQLDEFSQPIMAEKLLEESPRGLGLFLIQQLSDGVALRSDNGRTEFTMWFYREARGMSAAGSGE